MLLFEESILIVYGSSGLTGREIDDAESKLRVVAMNPRHHLWIA